MMVISLFQILLLVSGITKAAAGWFDSSGKSSSEALDEFLDLQFDEIDEAINSKLDKSLDEAFGKSDNVAVSSSDRGYVDDFVDSVFDSINQELNDLKHDKNAVYVSDEDDIRVKDPTQSIMDSIDKELDEMKRDPNAVYISDEGIRRDRYSDATMGMSNSKDEKNAERIGDDNEKGSPIPSGALFFLSAMILGGVLILYNKRHVILNPRDRRGYEQLPSVNMNPIKEEPNHDKEADYLRSIY